MITEKDLQEAIAECQGQRNPTANTCLKLASYYILQERMFPDSNKKNEERVVVPSYSYAGSSDTISYSSGTEFSDAIFGRSPDEIFEIIDELMTVVRTINPKLYDGVMSKILS